MYKKPAYTKLARLLLVATLFLSAYSSMAQVSCNSCTDELVVITVNGDNFSVEDNSWTLTDDNTAVVYASAGIGSIPNNTTVIDSVCVPKGADVTFSFGDSFGDGLSTGGGGSFTVDAVNCGAGNEASASGDFDFGDTTQFTICGTASAGVTYYSFQSGDWSSLNTWTTDPSGTLLTGSAIPSGCDDVVILANRTVTTNSTAVTAAAVTINANGVLDLKSTTGSAFSSLSGTGKLRLSTTTFPTGDFSAFASASGGTTELYDAANGTINNQIEFNDLVLTNGSGSSRTWSLGSDLTVNGDFNLTSTSGNLTLEVGNNTSSRTLTFKGDVTISSGATMSAFNSNAVHSMVVTGDITNNGIIDFSNNAQYTTPNNGAINVTFTGFNNSTIGGTGTQNDFHRIILDKGSDKTYILDIDALNFELFGRTDQDDTTLLSINTVRKPIWLKNGTIKLGSNVIIDRITTGGDHFNVPSTTSFWINGATVNITNNVTATTLTGLLLEGELKVSSGTFNGGSGGGIIYEGIAQMNVEGGTVNVSQIRPSAGGSGAVSNDISYSQSGGSVTVRGDVGITSDVDAAEALFDLGNFDNTFTMSGGTLTVQDVSGAVTNDGILIGASQANISVTGGQLNIDVADGVNFDFNCTKSFRRINITNRSGTGTFTLNALSSLTVTDSLSIGANVIYLANDSNVTVGESFIIDGTYTPGTNTTLFNGTGSVLFENNGTISGDLNNLTINKPSGDLTFAGSASTFVVGGNLSLTSGDIADGGKTIEVQGDLTSNVTHTGAGSIQFSTNAAHAVGGDGSAVFESIEITGPVGTDVVVTSSADITVNGDITFTAGNTNIDRILDIGTTSLTMSSAASFAGTLGLNGTGLLMVRTAGNNSDGSITKTFSTNTFTFPFGTGTTYTPAAITFAANPTSYGSITIIPVASEHPNVTNTGQAINYYWKTSSSGFDFANTTVSHVYTYDASDIVEDEADFIPGRFTTTAWTSGLTSAVNTTTNEITFSGSSYQNTIDGAYTAADNNPTTPEAFGGVEVYYSYTDGGNWNDLATWSTSGHTGTQVQPAQIPQANSVVIIGNGDSIITSADGAICGDLTIEAGAALDMLSTVNHDFGNLSGQGKLRLASDNFFPAGDAQDFLSLGGGTVEFYLDGGQSDPPTSITQYNNLILNSTGTAGRIRITGGFDVVGDFRAVCASGTRTIQFNSGTFNITGDMNIEGIARVRYNAASPIVTINVEGDVNISSGAQFITNSNSGTYTHFLNIGGSLNCDGRFDMYRASGRATDVTFTGEGDAKITGNPSTNNVDFHRIIVDKGSDTSNTLTVDIGGNFIPRIEDWLVLNNGTFRFSRTGTIFLNTQAINYTIPATAGVSINHPTATLTINDVASDDADLILQGKLELLDGTINIGDPTDAASGNDIQYSSVGSPEIVVAGGTFTVNGSVRRGLSTVAGALVYRQTGGDVIIEGKNADATRGKFEIVNTGSIFEMSGASTFTVRRGGGTTFGDLYLRAASSTVTSGEIIFALGSAIGAQSFILNSNTNLNDLTITSFDGTNTAGVTLNISDITFQGDLTINANSSLDDGDVDISIAGNIVNNGSFTTGAATTQTLTSTATSITGNFSGANAFNNLVLAADNDVVLQSSSPIQIKGDLTINTGASIDDGDNLITLLGNITNNGAITSTTNSGTSGISFSGTSAQTITGTGSYGNFILNNANDVTTNSSFTIDRRITFTDGTLSIAEKRITFGTNSDVGGTPSVSSMIITNGTTTDGGLTKNFPASAQDFTFHVGVVGKYTPARFNFTANSATGTINLKNINQANLATTDAANTQLDYYWKVTPTGFGSPTLTHVYTYDQGDVNGTEGSYRTGRFESGNWNPQNGTAGTVNTTNNTMTLTGVNYIDGQYTAGELAEFGTPPTYYSITNGNWEDASSWSLVSHSGTPASTSPTSSATVIIDVAHTITVIANNLEIQSVEINGTLDFGDSFGHNFPSGSGSGKIIINTNNQDNYVLPAGSFDDFFNTVGSTIEYTGTIDASLVASTSTYNNIILSGSSTKTIPNFDLLIKGDLTISAGALSNSTNNRDITIRGDWTNSVGSTGFVPGTGTVVFDSSGQELVGTTTFNNVTVNTDTDSDTWALNNASITVNGNFTLTQGDIDLSTGTNLINFGAGTTTDISSGEIIGSSTASLTIASTTFTGGNLNFASGNEELDNLIIIGTTETFNLTSDFTIHGDINIFSGAALQIGSNELTLNGVTSLAASTLIGSTSSDIILGGSSASVELPSGLSNLKSLTVNNTNGANTAGTLTINDSLILSNGGLTTSGTLSMADGTWAVRNGGSVTGLSFGTTVNVLYNGTSTVTTGDELPTSGTVLQTLTIDNNSNNVTLGKDITVNSTLNLTSGNLNLDTRTLTIEGSIAGSTAIHSTGSGSLVINGSGALNALKLGVEDHVLNNLTINRNTTLTLASDVEVDGILTFTDGLLQLDANILTFGPSATVAGTPSASSMVVTNSTGGVRREYNSTGSFTFPVGETTSTTEYSPITVNFTAGSFGGGAYTEVTVTDAASTNGCSSGTNNISRHWDVSQNGITGFTAEVTMNYLDADINGGDESLIASKLFTSACMNWEFANTGANTLTFITDEFGEFTGGEITLATEPTVVASGLGFTNIDIEDFTINWTSGNGARTLIIAKEGSAVDVFPVDGEYYAADANFGTGAELGTGNYVVYNGTGNTVALTGLTTNENYHFAIISYNVNDTLSQNYDADVASDIQNTYLQLNITTFLSAPYNGSEISTDLNSNGLIPLTHPFTDAAIFPPGLTGSVASIPNADVVDWVLVTVRYGSSAANATDENRLAAKPAFLLKDGSIVDLTGNSPLLMETSEAQDNIFVVVYHRNHLPILSATALTTIGNTYTYNFSTAPTQAFKPEVLTDIGGGLYGQRSGVTETMTTIWNIDINDINQVWDDRNQTGYHFGDVNFDGVVDAEDRKEVWNNNGNEGTLPD